MKLSDYANMNDWWKRLDEAIARQVNLGLAGRKEFLMPLMKLVDLTGQIAQEVQPIQAKVDADPSYTPAYSAGMHLQVTTENGEVLVVQVPLQQGPSTPPDKDHPTGTYGTPVWGPCQADLRASTYHDPYRPGTVMADTDGTEYVWVQDEGFVLATSVPGGSDLGKLATAAHAALDAVVNAAQSK